MPQRRKRTDVISRKTWLNYLPWVVVFLLLGVVLGLYLGVIRPMKQEKKILQENLWAAGEDAQDCEEKQFQIESENQEMKKYIQSLEVDNKTPFRVLVHVNGVFWGWVGARREFRFTGIPSGKVVVYGETQYAEFFWGPKPLECRQKASWRLTF